MTEKITEYFLVNKNGEYLYAEQVSENEVEVYGYNSKERAISFNSENAAFNEANNMISGLGKFKYWISEKDRPESIIKAVISLTKVRDII